MAYVLVLTALADLPVRMTEIRALQMCAQPLANAARIRPLQMVLYAPAEPVRAAYARLLVFQMRVLKIAMETPVL